MRIRRKYGSRVNCWFVNLFIYLFVYLFIFLFYREADLEDGNGDVAIYKQKCERIMRELEFTRRRLQQQHEDDLEQLVGLKKQLEKKVC